MPAAVPKRCRHRGCGNRTTERHGYCTQHADKASWGGYQQSQARKGKRIYQTPEWRNEIVPRVKEQAQHLCLNCLYSTPPIVKPGHICEHIVPVSKGGDESDENLSYFCESCANHKTGWEKNQTVTSIRSRYAHTSIESHVSGGMGVKLSSRNHPL